MTDEPQLTRTGAAHVATAAGAERAAGSGSGSGSVHGSASALPPFESVLMRLQELEAVGAHAEAFAQALDHIRAEDRRIAQAQARRARLLAHVSEAAVIEARARAHSSEEDVDMAVRERVAEIAVATRQSHGTIREDLARAGLLVERFPATADAFEAGRVSERHVRAILSPGVNIADDQARFTYERTLLAAATTSTPAQLRARAKLAAERHLDRSLDERHAEARESRAVRLFPDEDAMCRIEATVPLVLGTAIHDRLTAQAKAVRTANPDEPRSYDHLRADLLCELLLTTDLADTCHAEAGGGGDGEGLAGPHAAARGIDARITITVPVLTLLGRDDHPALLNGTTPVPLDDARELASAAPSFTRLLTDPITGFALTSDTRLATAAQRAFLTARDGTCRMPGCTRAAHRCDIDHTVPHAEGGPTSIGNLASVCRAHHVLKHHSAWRLRQLGSGILAWTGPTGREYVDRPDQVGPTFTPRDPALAGTTLADAALAGTTRADAALAGATLADAAHAGAAHASPEPGGPRRRESSGARSRPRPTRLLDDPARDQSAPTTIRLRPPGTERRISPTRTRPPTTDHGDDPPF